MREVCVCVGAACVPATCLPKHMKEARAVVQHSKLHILACLMLAFGGGAAVRAECVVDVSSGASRVGVNDELLASPLANLPG